MSAGLLALLLVFEMLIDGSVAQAAGNYDKSDYKGYTSYRYIYVKTTSDVYHLEEGAVFDGRGRLQSNPIYGKINKGELIGTVLYQLGSYRSPKKVDGKKLGWRCSFDGDYAQRENYSRSL